MPDALLELPAVGVRLAGVDLRQLRLRLGPRESGEIAAPVLGPVDLATAERAEQGKDGAG